MTSGLEVSMETGTGTGRANRFDDRNHPVEFVLHRNRVRTRTVIRRRHR